MRAGKEKAAKIKRDRGFIMSSAWFTEMGNNAHNWSSSASELFAATLILRREQDKEEKRVLKPGALVGMPCEQKRGKWHSLARLCDDANIALTSSEREILGKLSDCIRYQGRYPVARHWEHMEPVFYWSDEWDLTIARFVTKLWRQLEIPLRGVPIGGAAL
jgi:hypothetical protein